MDEKIEKAKDLIGEGYTADYIKPVITIPGTLTSTLVLTSPEGKEERFEFQGMEVSAADTQFIRYLNNDVFKLPQ